MPDSPANKAHDTGSETFHKTALVELKNGRVIFKQKSHSFEKHSETLQGLVKFREMLQERIANGGSALSTIDDEYKPLIAKLVHESDRTLTTLAKHVHSQLLPTDDDEDLAEGDTPGAVLLPVSVIEGAIQEVAQRNNYGIQTDLGVKAPAVTCVWRWEVAQSNRHWLPKNAQEKAASRLADRIKAKNDLMGIFSALSEDERRQVLHIKSNTRGQNGDTPTSQNPPDPQSGSTEVLRSAGAAESEQSKPKVGRPKKDAEKATKAKKVKEAQKSLMTSFFTKPKQSNELSNKGSSSVAGPSTGYSDFEKTFKPFVLKKGAQLAPINAFLQRKPDTIANGTRDDAIVIDEDKPSASNAKIANKTTQERLGQILSALPPSVVGPLRRPQKATAQRVKTYYPVAVRDLFKQLSEVELFGDTTAVRRIHDQLSNRKLLPAKVLIFKEDSRPGYYGTWSRSSRLVGPRTPHAKDVLEIDYEYDSGEEWEEEPAGDADDVLDDAEDEDVTEDRDSDIDDWLVDDDEVEEGAPLDERAASPVLPILLPKRKTDYADPKPTKKRKVVIPLVPFTKGPCWETSIGQNDSAFEPYRIRLLNDTPFPIDPFTFVSTMGEIKTIKQTEKGFAVPALPTHVIKNDPTKSTDSSPVSAAPKKPAPVPRTAFPDEHLPVLLSKINTVQAANLTVLVEAVSQELRQHKVKKNAIEAKIKEVGEKCKVRKFWVVKENQPVASA